MGEPLTLLKPVNVPRPRKRGVRVYHNISYTLMSAHGNVFKGKIVAIFKMRGRKHILLSVK